MSRCATSPDARILDGRALRVTWRPAAGREAGQREAGSALIAVIGILGLLAVASGALLFLTSIEVVSSAHHRDAQELAYAAEAALAVAVLELQVMPSWTNALAGAALPAFRDLTQMPALADGSLADLASLTVALQAESDALGSFGPDTPRWRLFAYGRAGSLAPAAATSIAYLVIWIADDAGDADGNPEADANGILQVRADALGPRFARRGVAASIRRADPAPAAVRVLTWRRAR
jgi:hypothetical protein